MIHDPGKKIKRENAKKTIFFEPEGRKRENGRKKRAGAGRKAGKQAECSRLALIFS